jgi:TnpA family transposase
MWSKTGTVPTTSFLRPGGEVATNCVEDQEITVLALHLLQVNPVYINMLTIQRLL